MFKKTHLIRKLRTSVYLETLLLSTVLSVVILRYFSVFDYTGNITIFIAQLLCGIVLMLAATLFVLIFYGRYVEQISAVLAGVGLGICSDQIEQFITFNNDSFFLDTLHLIYFFSIVLFLLARHLLASRKASVRDYLVNSYQMLLDGLVTPGRPTSYYDHIEYLLKKAGRKNLAVQPLHKLLHLQLKDSPVISEEHPPVFRKMELWYEKISRKNHLEYLAIIFFILFFAFNAYNIIQPLFDGTVFAFSDLSQLEQLQCYSLIIIAIVIIGGLIEFIYSHRNAFITLEISVYLSLYLLQIFIIDNNSSIGLIGIISSIIAILTLKVLIKLEDHHLHKHTLGRLQLP